MIFADPAPWTLSTDPLGVHRPPVKNLCYRRSLRSGVGNIRHAKHTHVAREHFPIVLNSWKYFFMKTTLRLAFNCMSKVKYISFVKTLTYLVGCCEIQPFELYSISIGPRRTVYFIMWPAGQKSCPSLSYMNREIKGLTINCF